MDKLSPDVQKSLQNIQKSIEEREGAKQHQLEFWPEKDLAVPNELSRSALFAAIDPRKKKEYRKGALIAAQGVYSIHYTGPQLDQTHADVFEGILQIARGTLEGNDVRFTAHRLLKIIGRKTGGRDHKWLFSAFQDLTATSVAISKEGKRVFWGSLLPQGEGELETGKYCVKINRNLAKLLERGFTRVEWNQRHQLKNKPLAQWLQFYYASHAKPVPVSVKFLHEMSGSGTNTIKKFRQNLKLALDNILAAGVISEWSIDPKTDLVHVTRCPSPSQEKYLSGKAE